MPRKGVDPGMPRSLPGPLGTGAGRLPTPLPAGVLPPDDSKLWQFSVPKAIQAGESYIQDDTREWFAERDHKVVIQREYPDHPRWVIDGKNSVRAKMFNAGIACEIHMLARITAGKPEYPDWVPARMSVKQQQADVAYRLTKAARKVFIAEGEDAMKTFAQKAPGQFIKTMMATFIPKKIESDVNLNPGSSLSTEDADKLIEALKDEMARREQEMKIVNAEDVLNFEPPKDLVGELNAVTERLIDATGDPNRMPSTIRTPGRVEITQRLGHVVDLEADLVDSNVNWDD